MGVPKKYLPCAEACRHELTCAPPGTPRDITAIASCTKRCDKSEKELSAIKGCIVKGCGRNFTACVAEKTGRLAEIKKVKADCETVCAKAGSCRKGAGGAGCVKRCLEGGTGSTEYRAREACAAKACGKAYDQCLLSELKVAPADERCLAACRWDLGCERGNQSGDLAQLQQCLKGCKYTDEDLAMRRYCEPMGCGSGFEACMKKRRAAAQTRPKVDTPEITRCKSLCAQADKCQAGSGGTACVDRCLDTKRSKAEFTAREKCNGRTCSAYGDCVLVNLKLTKAGSRCVPLCSKQLECSGGGPPLPGAIVACANSCKATDDEVRAASACANEACGAPLGACMKKATAAKVLTPAEQRCTTLCSQAERCTPGTGGQKCVDRCLDGGGESKTEFDIREKCAKNDCKGYDECMMNEILGGSSKEKK